MSFVEGLREPVAALVTWLFVGMCFVTLVTFAGELSCDLGCRAPGCGSGFFGLTSALEAGASCLSTFIPVDAIAPVAIASKAAISFSVRESSRARPASARSFLLACSSGSPCRTSEGARFFRCPFQKFFIALSVRPGRNFAIAAHLFPSSWCFAMIRASSSAEKGSFRRLGSSWLNHRSRQLLPFRPVPKVLATSDQFWGPYVSTSWISLTSSSCVQHVRRPDELSSQKSLS
mmetsp:Transcript_15522/g.44133  ORF Transcript_15522/g.44133 Transcript_15522/m.44133 type:complete len:232 (+) Transcript_15522:2927-3622(+)